jgi:hypothetical protein
MFGRRDTNYCQLKVRYLKMMLATAFPMFAAGINDTEDRILAYTVIDTVVMVHTVSWIPRTLCPVVIDTANTKPVGYFVDYHAEINARNGCSFFS